MSKLYVQRVEPVWSYNGTLAATGSITSGSFPTAGYARLTGTLISSASLTSLRIHQSTDYGSNYDYYSDYAPSACSGSGFSIEVIGNAAKITACMGATASANILRSAWFMRPVY